MIHIFSEITGVSEVDSWECLGVANEFVADEDLCFVDQILVEKVAEECAATFSHDVGGLMFFNEVGEELF